MNYGCFIYFYLYKFKPELKCVLIIYNVIQIKVGNKFTTSMLLLSSKHSKVKLQSKVLESNTILDFTNWNKCLSSTS